MAIGPVKKMNPDKAILFFFFLLRMIHPELTTVANPPLFLPEEDSP